MKPTPQNLRMIRQAAGLTQAEAASMMGLSGLGRVSEYENGRKPIDPARWELFLIKTGRHHSFGPLQKVAT